MNDTIETLTTIDLTHVTGGFLPRPQTLTPGDLKVTETPWKTGPLPIDATKVDPVIHY
jgi:hypothetical protein